MMKHPSLPNNQANRKLGENVLSLEAPSAAAQEGVRMEVELVLGGGGLRRLERRREQRKKKADRPGTQGKCG